MEHRNVFGLWGWRPFLFLLAFAATNGLTALGLPLQAAEVPPQATVPFDSALFLPVLLNVAQPPEPACPTTSQAAFQAIPVDGPPIDHPDELHADLNLSLRGSVPVAEARTLVDVNGPADALAPQLPAIFQDERTPAFTSTHRVYKWDWDCGEHGCRSSELTSRAVTLLGMAVSSGEVLSLPSRSPQIYAGGYIALVLYAQEERITLGYTRHDSVAPGYTVHIEGICVDPNLLALYRQSNSEERALLPALHNGEALGTAQSQEIRISVRDKGTFMDPRSRKDWWKGR